MPVVTASAVAEGVWDSITHYRENAVDLNAVDEQAQ
jgi:hypothetical protein